MGSPRKVTLYHHSDENGVEKEYEVVCLVHAGSPGRTYGDPGDCYPADPPEVEVISCEDTDTGVENEKLLNLLQDDLNFFNQVCESASNDEQSRRESAMEDAADAQRERDWESRNG